MNAVPAETRNPSLTAPQAAQHLLNRRRARSDVVAYAGYIDVPGRPLSDDPECDLFAPVETNLAGHHELILRTCARTAARPYGRAMLLFPPGSAKTTYGSVVFPSHYLGEEAGRRLILTSYAQPLAEKMGRRTRSIIRQARYRAIFNNGLSRDSQAAAQFILQNGSEYMASGLLGGITGNRADGAQIDDPIKGREDAESEVVRDKTWDAYNDDLLTRLRPGGWLVLTQCMVGSTQVLMADGAYRTLRRIRVGDSVATYDGGRRSVSTILRWSNQGTDQVFELESRSGAKTRANARHPFLVQHNGEFQWLRLEKLDVGHALVRLRTEHIADGSASSKAAESLHNARNGAPRITTSGVGVSDFGRRPSTALLGEPPTSNIATVLLRNATKRFFSLKAACVRFVNSLRLARYAPTGPVSSASTTTTKPAVFEVCSATTATWPSATPSLRPCSQQQPSTCDFTVDEIVAIRPVGCEEVFDVQVERTENFIADGFVSHNTRWHEEDLAGRILPDGWSGDSGMFVGRDGLDWEILCVQARCETTTDPLRRAIGEYLWPEWFDMKHWATHQADARKWNSLFQQRPQPLEGAFFTAGDMLGADGKPIETPTRVNAVFAIIDSAMKDGKPHDGLACMFFALTRLNLPVNPPLAVIDWDLIQIKGAFLNEWVPSVFTRLELFARECAAFSGSLGVFVEDKSSGTVLLQQTQHPNWLREHPTWRTHAIQSDLTAQGKKGKAANASGYVRAGQVKWTRRAYERVVTFKGVTKNHAWGQVLKFSTDSKDTDPDDCLDCLTYGVALALGNSKGF